MTFSKTHFWEDRFVQGFIAGLIGWLAQCALTIPMYLLHISKFLFAYYAAALGWGKAPQGVWGILFAETIVFFMQGTFGGMFAMLIKSISSVAVILKGGLFGGFAWATIFSVGILFKLKPVYPIDPRTAFIIFSGSMIWGIVTGWALLIINEKFGVKN
jgi:hypothetical protein